MPDYGSIKYSKKLIEYSGKLADNRLSVDNLMSKYVGSEKEAKMRSIFAIFDTLDSLENGKVKQDGYIDYRFIQNADAFFGSGEHWGYVSNNAVESFNSLKQNGVNVADVEQAFNDIFEVLDNIKNPDVIEPNKKETSDVSMLSKEFQDIPQEILEFYGDSVVNIKMVKGYNLPENTYMLQEKNDNGYNYYVFENGQAEQCGFYTEYSVDENESGRRLLTGEKEIQYGDIDINEFKYNSGLIIRCDNENLTHSKIFNKTEFIYKTTDTGDLENPKGNLNSIILNKGLPNQLVLNVEKDDNGDINLKIEDSNSHNINEQSLNNLKEVLNSGLEIGTDFELTYLGDCNINVLKFGE